jgi:hypothetical protein
MNLIAMSLPLLFAPVLYTVLVKLSALILRRIQLSWKHAFVFGLLAMLVGAIGMSANFATGRIVPAPLVVLVGVAAQLALGAWYFKDRAVMVSGSPVGPIRGALLPLIAMVVLLILATTVVVLFPPGLSHDGRQ